MRRVRPVLSALIAVVVAGCVASPVTPTEEPSPPPVTALPSATPLVTDAPATSALESPAVVVTKGVPFESASLNELGMLDVYAPGPDLGWPVVVMLHGDPMTLDRGYLAQYATWVAELGFVVFVPTWGHSGGAEYDAMTFYEMGMADAAQAACATAFAAEHAEDYGGDAASLTVFGHSAGAMVGSVVVLAQPELRPGCLASAKSATPKVDFLVPWEGDWLMIYNFWDSILADDPAVMETITPWAHLPGPAGLRWVFVRSETPGESRSATDARGPDGWLALRDPDGGLTAALEENGAFDDNLIGPADSDDVLVDKLEAQDADVRVLIMPDSNHNHLSAAGWQVFLGAFREIGER